MPIVKGKIEMYHCNQCDHQWVPRKGVVTDPMLQPGRCPLCKSVYWQRPKGWAAKA